MKNDIQSIDNNQSKNQYVNQFLNEIKKDVNVIDSMLPNNSPDALSGKPVGSKNKLGKWKVYGKNECGWTVKQKKYMDDNKIDYDYINCKENPSECPEGIKGFPFNISPEGEEIEGYVEI